MEMHQYAIVRLASSVSRSVSDSHFPIDLSNDEDFHIFFPLCHICLPYVLDLGEQIGLSETVHREPSRFINCRKQ